MKKITFLLICTSIVGLFIFQSCQQDNLVSEAQNQSDLVSEINEQKVYTTQQEFYGVNPNVEHKIAYDQFILLDESIQMAIFDKMSNSKRLSLWKEKLEKDLAQEELSNEVRELIQKFITTMDEETFDSNLSSFTDLLENLSESDKINFTKFSGKVKNNENSIILRSASCDQRWCWCAWGSEGAPPAYYCDDDCTSTDSGCGWFRLQSCNQKCKKI